MKNKQITFLVSRVPGPGAHPGGCLAGPGLRGAGDPEAERSRYGLLGVQTQVLLHYLCLEAALWRRADEPEQWSYWLGEPRQHH